MNSEDLGVPTRVEPGLRYTKHAYLRICKVTSNLIPFVIDASYIQMTYFGSPHIRSVLSCSETFWCMAQSTFKMTIIIIRGLAHGRCC